MPGLRGRVPLSQNGWMLPEVLHQLRDHAVPVPWLCLPIEPNARIPRAVAALAQPSPIRCEREQEGGGPAQRTGKVRHRRIDGDDEIEILDDRSGVLEIPDLRRDVD